MTTAQEHAERIALALEAGPTPGPWRWEINMTNKSIHLVGGRPMFDKTVMQFTRWGMGDAAPMFNEAIAGDKYNIMTRVSDRSDWIEPFPGREHHARWCSRVKHPDANWIEAATPAALTALLSERTALLARVGELEGALSDIATLLSSSWPDRCQKNVRIARDALKG
jgi:hypothetical protein